MFELTDAAAEAAEPDRGAGTLERSSNGHRANGGAAAGSLFECLGEVPECRRDRGKRYPLNTVLASHRRCPSGRLPRCERVRPVRRPALPGADRGSGCVLEPEQAALHRARNHHLPQHPRRAAARDPGQRIGQWTGQHLHGTCACRHGRHLRGASKQTEDGRRMMVARRWNTTPAWSSGRWRSTARATKSRPYASSPAASTSQADCHRRDARQHETARCLLGRRADYVISAIKDNQETILEEAIDFSDAPWHETVDKGHGRIERRRCAAPSNLSGAEWDTRTSTGAARRCASNASARSSRPARAIHRSDLDGPHLARHRPRRARRSFWPWSVTTGTSKTGCTRARLHLRRRPRRAYVRHLPRNLACLTNVPSPSCSVAASATCPRPTATMPPARRIALDAILIAPTA